MAHKWLKWPMPPTSSGTEKLGRQSVSRHFSPQNCEFGSAERRLSTDPAIFPASLRDSQASGSGNRKSCHFFCRNGRRRVRARPQSGNRCLIRPSLPAPADQFIQVPQTRNKAKTYQTGRKKMLAELDGTQAEAAETDKALKEILERIGV